MPYCSNCGKQVEETAKFCSECGAELTVEVIDAEAQQELPSRKRRLNRWYALITFMVCEAVAIIGTLPLIIDSVSVSNRWGIPVDTRVVYRAFWDYSAALPALVIVGAILILFFTRYETRKFRTIATLAAVFCLLATALGISRLQVPSLLCQIYMSLKKR